MRKGAAANVRSMSGMKSFASRLRAVRSHRSNLALVAAGCVLLLLAFAWRFAIAPALKVEPTDIDQVLYYDGVLGNYINPPGQPAIGAQPVKIPVRVERTLLSKPLLSTPGTSIIETLTDLLVPDTRQELSSTRRVYALDRRTGEMVKDGKADAERSGYFLVFPFDTPKGSVPYWSELAGRTYPAEYRKAALVGRLPVYRFSVSFGNQPVAEAPAGYPAAMTGGQLKQLLAMPDLTVRDGDTVALAYTGSSTVELKVEPRAGNIVETRGDESVSLTAKGPGGQLIATRLLHRLEYTQNKVSVKAAERFASDEVAKLNLQFTYLPLGLLVLGLGILIIGIFAGVKVDERARDARGATV